MAMMFTPAPGKNTQLSVSHTRREEGGKRETGFGECGVQDGNARRSVSGRPYRQHAAAMPKGTGAREGGGWGEGEEDLQTLW